MGTFRRVTAGLLGLVLCASVGAGEENSAAVLIEHASVAMRSNPEVSKQDAERALQLIRRSPDADLEVRARLLLCDYYSERDAGAAQLQIEAASLLLPAVRRKGLRAGVLTCRGETAESAGDYSHALADFDEAVVVATAADDENMLAEALFSRGYLRALQGDYAAGMSDAQRSQELFTQLDLPQHALTALSVIATIYNRMGDYGQAAQIYERARTQQHGAGLRRDEAVSFYNLGRARQKLGQWDAARASYSAGLSLCRELNYTRGMGIRVVWARVGGQRDGGSERCVELAGSGHRNAWDDAGREIECTDAARPRDGATQAAARSRGAGLPRAGGIGIQAGQFAG